MYTMWVDMNDPINGFSFKPSPLKPVPLFMQPRAVEPLTYLRYQPSHNSDISGTCTVRHSRLLSPVLPTRGELALMPPGVGWRGLHRDTEPVIRKRRLRSSTVKEEPLRKPSSRLKASNRHSEPASPAFPTAWDTERSTRGNLRGSSEWCLDGREAQELDIEQRGVLVGRVAGRSVHTLSSDGASDHINYTYAG